MKAPFSCSAPSLPEAKSGLMSTSSRTLCGLETHWSLSIASLGVLPRHEGCRIGAGMITDIGRKKMTTKRVALYARVSTLNHGQDPEVQLRELRAYCERRGFEIVDEYVDTGISGSRERRPALDKLITACRKRLVDGVVVYRYDRFARSLRQLVNALEEFRSLGIDFISIHEGVDTSTPNGRLVFGIFASIAEFE